MSDAAAELEALKARLTVESLESDMLALRMLGMITHGNIHAAAHMLAQRLTDAP